MAFKIAEPLRNVLVYKMYISSDGVIILVHEFILGGGLTFYNFRIYFIFTGYPGAPTLEGST